MQSTGVLLSMLKRRMQSASPSQHCPTAETAGETTDEAADEAAGSITGEAAAGSGAATAGGNDLGTVCFQTSNPSGSMG